MRLTEQESSLLIEIWSSCKNHIPTKDRQQAGTDFIDVILSSGYDMLNVYEELYGLDTTLDRALNIVAEETESEDDEDEWLDEEWDE
tara:strand:+ start:1200 stop:1460 length:261 start_codon:yes stop_codon:yes gene_type:complete